MGRVRSRFVLSGTPIQNRLSELWCLLNLVTHKEFQVIVVTLEMIWGLRIVVGQEII